MSANSVKAEFSRLVTMYYAGQYLEVEKGATRLVEQYPDFGLGWKLLSASLLLQEKDDLFALQMATKLLPGEAELHNNLGRALARSLTKHGRNPEAEACFRRALQIKPDYAEAHFNLGTLLHERGCLDEAEACFRRALQVKPDCADSYGHLGEVLREQGKREEALACFQQQMKLVPENNAIHQHNIASVMGDNTERAPIQYVENLFDGYANIFDTNLQDNLKYAVPEKLVAIITQHLILPAEKWNVLDLGCGTGLVALPMAPFARQLVGVDLSSKMLERARARNLYQRLEHSDLLTMMRRENASSYEVIIAADVFVYLGKLDEIIGEIKRLLCPGGVFAFSVEELVTPRGGVDGQSTQLEYQLENTGRYTHSAHYLTKLALDKGLLIEQTIPTQIRIERENPVNGYLALWKKG